MKVIVMVGHVQEVVGQLKEVSLESLKPAAHASMLFDASGIDYAKLSSFTQDVHLVLDDAPTLTAYTTNFAPAYELGKPIPINLPTFTGTNVEFSAVNLPKGLQIDKKTGAIQGTPSKAGRFKTTVTINNAAGSSTFDLPAFVQEQTRWGRGGSFHYRNITISDGDKTASGRGMATFVQGTVSQGCFCVSLTFGNTGDEDQWIGVVPPQINYGDFPWQNNRKCWGLKADGMVYVNGSESGAGWNFKGKSVTMSLDMEARSVTFHMDGEEDIIIDSLPKEVRPAVHLWDNSVTITGC